MNYRKGLFRLAIVLSPIFGVLEVWVNRKLIPSRYKGGRYNEIEYTPIGRFLDVVLNDWLFENGFWFSKSYASVDLPPDIILDGFAFLLGCVFPFFVFFSTKFVATGSFRNESWQWSHMQNPFFRFTFILVPIFGVLGVWSNLDIVLNDWFFIMIGYPDGFWFSRWFLVFQEYHIDLPDIILDGFAFLLGCVFPFCVFFSTKFIMGFIVKGFNDDG